MKLIDQFLSDDGLDLVHAYGTGCDDVPVFVEIANGFFNHLLECVIFVNSSKLIHEIQSIGLL